MPRGAGGIVSASLTLSIVPPDSRTASTAFLQFRGTPTAMLSASVWGVMGRSSLLLWNASVTGGRSFGLDAEHFGRPPDETEKLQSLPRARNRAAVAN